jgi:hypothetical protein
MELDETIRRILSDISTNEDDILTKQHYIPIRFFIYFLKLAYSIGFNEGLRSHTHHKSIIRIKGEEIKPYKSIADAARDIKVNKSNIHRVLTNKRKTCKGYKFEYI